MEAVTARLQQLETALQAQKGRADAAEARLTLVAADVSAAGAAAAAAHAAASTAPPTTTPPPAAAPGTSTREIVDNKLAAKPKSFSGKESEWAAWAFKWKAYVAALDARMGEALIEARTLTDDRVLNAALDADAAARSRQLYFALVLIVEGEALSVIKPAGNGEGFYAWKLLLDRYESDRPGRSAGMLLSLLSFVFNASAMEASIGDFDYAVQRYEEQTRERVADSLKVAILQKNCVDNELKNHLVLNAGRIRTWVEAKAEVKIVLLTRRAATDGGCVVPMDIGTVDAGKRGRGRGGKDRSGKGKGDKGGKSDRGGKGKSDGKSNEHKDKECRYCHKMGHIAIQCRKRIADEKKAKGISAIEEPAAEPGQRPVTSIEVPSGSASSYQVSWILALEYESVLVDTIDHSRLLIYSGPAATVCPPSHAPHQPVVGTPNALRLVGAGGHALQHFGSKQVAYTKGDKQLGVNWEVSDVRRPTVGVHDSVSHGNSYVFSPSGSYWIPEDISFEHPKAVTLHDDGQLYFLETDGFADSDATQHPVAAVERPPAVPPEGFPTRDELFDDEMLPNSEPGSSSAGPAPVRAAAARPAGATAARVERVSEDAARAMPQRDARETFAKKVPYTPTIEEKRAHELTRVPCRAWCKTCVSAKANDDAHHRRERNELEVDEVQIDYLFLGPEPQLLEPILAFLKAVHVNSGASALTFGTKHLTAYMIHCLVASIEQWGSGSIVLKSDQENAILALAREVKDMRVKHNTKVEQVTRGNHQAFCCVERGNEEAAKEIRALKLGLEARVQERLPADHHIMPWLGRHAGWLLTRFAVHQSSGRTSYELLRGRPYRGEICEIGESVWARRPGEPPRTGKIEGRWYSGVWIGKTESSDEHLIADVEGTNRYRTVRRRPEKERWNVEAIHTFSGQPWDLKLKPTRGPMPLLDQPSHRGAPAEGAGCRCGATCSSRTGGFIRRRAGGQPRRPGTRKWGRCDGGAKQCSGRSSEPTIGRWRR